MSHEKRLVTASLHDKSYFLQLAFDHHWHSKEGYLCTSSNPVTAVVIADFLHVI